MRVVQSEGSTIQSVSCASNAPDVLGALDVADLATHAVNKLAGKAAIQAAIAQATIFKIGETPLRAATGLPTGFSLLDAQLPGGGWPQGALTEILCDEQGFGEVSLLLPALLDDVEVVQ